MYREHTVGVVVPAYNEAGFVGEVIETLPEFVDRIYAVDDCSTDGTWAEIQRAAGVDPAGGASDERRASGPSAGDELTDGSGGNAGVLETEVPSVDDRSAPPADEPAVPAGSTAPQSDRVVPIQHEENRGVGGAIKTGYQRAREEEMDVTVVVGADGQMDPDRMPSLLDPIVEGKADYAKGNRLLDPDHHEEMPRHRVVGNGILTLLTKIATGYWQIGDPQMGYTAISLEALETADVDGMYEYYGYCNDLLVRLSQAGLRVADVPCPLHYGDEESHITYRSYIPRVSSMLLGSFLRRLWSGKGSAAGASRLGLFVGGAAAVALGVLGLLVGALRSAVGGSADAAAAADAGDDADVAPAQADYENGDELEIAVELAGEDDAEDGADAASADEAAVTADAGDVAEDDAAVADGGVDEIETAADRAESVDRQSGNSSRSKLAIVVGVAALLGAMLLDATTNATKNYTDRLPDEQD